MRWWARTPGSMRADRPELGRCHCARTSIRHRARVAAGGVLSEVTLPGHPRTRGTGGVIPIRCGHRARRRRHGEPEVLQVSAEIIPDVVTVAKTPVPRAAPRPHGHVIVCGLGGIGLRIVEQLHRSGEAVMVLEEYADRTQLDVVRGWGVSTAGSHGNSSATLTAAGVQRARAVVCVLDDELKNLEIALVTREMRPDVRVLSLIHISEPTRRTPIS